MFQNWKSALGIGGVLLTLLPLSAQAGADGRKNTAIALGAAAAYELLHGKTTEALALGAGAAYAGKRYEDARKDERNRRNGRYYYGSSQNYDPYSNNGYNNNGYNNNDPYNNDPYNNGYNNNSSYDNGQDYETYNGRGSQYNSNFNRSSNRGQIFQQWRGNGKKQGWDGRSLPPGQYKKLNRERGYDPGR